MLANQLNVQFVHSFYQKVDILTKALSIVKFINIRRKISITCMPLSLRRDVDVIMDEEVLDKQGKNDRHEGKCRTSASWEC